MMTRTLTRFAKREDGQALVEFALIMPFLLLFLVGIVEFGRAWNEHEVLTDAAREGARQAAMWDADNKVDADSINNVIKRVLFANGMNPDRAVITPSNLFGLSNTPLTVKLEYPYQFIFFGPLAKWTTGESSIVLTSTFTMRNE